MLLSPEPYRTRVPVLVKDRYRSGLTTDHMLAEFIYRYAWQVHGVYSLRPIIIAHLEFKICPTKNTTLTQLPYKTRVFGVFLQK